MPNRGLFPEILYLKGVRAALTWCELHSEVTRERLIFISYVNYQLMMPARIKSGIIKSGEKQMLRNYYAGPVGTHRSKSNNNILKDTLN